MLTSGNIYEACLCEAGPVLGYGDLTQAKALPSGRGNVVEDLDNEHRKMGCKMLAGAKGYDGKYGLGGWWHC